MYESKDIIIHSKQLIYYSVKKKERKKTPNCEIYMLPLKTGIQREQMYKQVQAGKVPGSW